MGRDVRLSTCGLIIGAALLCSGCGGGGGASQPLTGPLGGPADTPTPLRTVSSRNERTQTSSAGSITLRIQDIDLVNNPPTTNFSVFLLDAAGNPAANQHINFSYGAGLDVTPAAADRVTGSDGSLSGTISASAGGLFAFTVAADPGAPFNGLSVTLTISAPFPSTPTVAVPTATATGIVTPTLKPSPTATATATATLGGTSRAGGIQFISAAPSAIAVQENGLPGVQTFSILTFEVTDQLGSPLAGVLVDFSLAQVADEYLAPTHATTDSDGKVQVTLNSGKAALSVQVVAQVDKVVPPLLTRSTAVRILSGTQSQKGFSLAHQFHNVSGRVTSGLLDQITAFVADGAGIPVANTAVTFTTTGGAVGNQVLTDALGQATATLVTQAPIAADGQVNTLATTVGKREYVDKNGNGVCDDGIDTVVEVSEPYYDSNCNGVYDEGEPFVDLNHNGIFDVNQGTGSCADDVTIFESICTTFSGPTQVSLTRDGSGFLPAGGSAGYTLIVSDDVQNPIVGGSTISVAVQGSRARVVGVSAITIPDAITFNEIRDGISRFGFSIEDSNPTAATGETDGVIVTITSSGLPAGGNGSVVVSDSVTFLAAPTLTPTPTFTPTVLPSPTPTPVPPAIAPSQATLRAGTGAPPTSCNGATQMFVVTGGSPPFTVAAGGGCVSVASVSTSGGTFLFTAGDLLGNFTITVTDALNRTTAAGVSIEGPPTPSPTFTPTNTLTPTVPATVPATVTPPATPGAAFVRLDQILTNVTNNLDGSFTTIVSALVTDATGAVVGDHVPVEFSLANPVAGVSVTSPGFTHDPAPCTIDFAVVLQPGDALSCLKYVAALQGTTVMVRARVQMADGTFTEDVRAVTLIDTRPTATPTITSTAVVPPTPTPTIQPPGLVPGAVTLYAGVEAPPSCNGISQTFVVNGGAPPFTIAAAGVGCLSTSLVTASGGSFTFTTGNEVGTFLLTATDALGRIATSAVTEQGPPAAFIDVDLFENRRTDNGDGSYTSVATALVTDLNGATIADGVPVEFGLVNPVSGVSITSPGLSNQKQPCTVDFPVQPQPGDALACIKYLSSRQGSTITIRARVTTASGEVLEAERTVTLPDTRPSPSPTNTPTLAATNTPTITLTPSPFPTGQATFTPTVTPPVTPTAPVGSIAFVSALPATIGVRASGLPEQSVVTFQAKDTLSRPIVGAPVAFQLTGSGSEILNPGAAVTDVNGMVSTTVTSGFRATTVRITAEADSNGDGTPDIFVQSQVVGILGAPPAFNHFSVAAARLNVAGRVTYGLQDQISAYVNDRFGNAVPPQTSVSFITNAASVVDPTVTNASGVATATLLSEGVVPPTGIVTVLAFTRGEESFLDNNGNGKFDCSPEPNPPCHSLIDSLGPNNELDDNPEPRIDFRPLPSNLEPDPSKNDSACTVPPPSQLCNTKFDVNTPFELFVDSNGNGQFDSAAPNPTGNGFGQGTDGEWDNNIFVWDTVPVTFSGHLVTPVASPTSFSIPIGGSQVFTIEVHDDLLNPLVGGSTIAISSSVGSISGGSITVPDGESFNQIVDGLTRFSFVLSAGENIGDLVDTSIVVTVSSQNGNGTFVVATGQIPKSK